MHLTLSPVQITYPAHRKSQFYYPTDITSACNILNYQLTSSLRGVSSFETLVFCIILSQSDGISEPYKITGEDFFFNYIFIIGVLESKRDNGSF